MWGDRQRVPEGGRSFSIDIHTYYLQASVAALKKHEAATAKRQACAKEVRLCACTTDSLTISPHLVSHLNPTHPQTKQKAGSIEYHAKEEGDAAANRRTRDAERPVLEGQVAEAEAGIARAEAHLRWLARVKVASPGPGQGDGGVRAGEEPVPEVVKAFQRRARALEDLAAAKAAREEKARLLAVEGEGEGDEEGEEDGEDVEVNAEVAAGIRRLAMVESECVMKEAALKASAAVVVRAAAEEGGGGVMIGVEEKDREDEGKGDGEGGEEEARRLSAGGERRRVSFSDPPDDRQMMERCVVAMLRPCLSACLLVCMFVVWRWRMVGVG